MTLQIALFFLIILAMVVFMALELLPTDTIAITVMVILIVGGFVSPADGIAGLSNPAVVTILSLMILSVGLETTGVIAAIGKRLKRILKGKEWKKLTIILLIAGLFSALISTTAIVIVFMRILLKLSQKIPLNLSRFLIPLSFAGILGGSCTLIGTSTNLIVSSIAKDHNIPEFGIFEITPIGAIFFATGILYLLFIGRFMLQSKDKNDDNELTDFQKYLAEIVVNNDSKLIGRQLAETNFFKDSEIEITGCRKGIIWYPDTQLPEKVSAGDAFTIRTNVEKLAEIRRGSNFTILTRKKARSGALKDVGNKMLCEVFVKSNSRLLRRSIENVKFIQNFGAIVLAIKKNRLISLPRQKNETIETGDTLLLEIHKSDFKKLYNSHEYVVLQEHEGLAAKTEKRYLAASIMLLVILLAAFNILPIMVSALAGCVAMFVTGCLELQRAYRRVEWNVFFLLAGMIPLGTAMDNTGASLWIANGFIDYFGAVSPRVIISVLYVAVTLLSAIISNNATAILFAPIVISISSNIGMDPKPLLLTVMFAANMSFMSPIGYQTNTLVYGVGHYRFIDFIKVGGLLSIIIWLLASWLIPMFYF